MSQNTEFESFKNNLKAHIDNMDEGDPIVMVIASGGPDSAGGFEIFTGGDSRLALVGMLSVAKAGVLEEISELANETDDAELEEEEE